MSEDELALLLLDGCEGERREGGERWVSEMKMKWMAQSTAIYWKAASRAPKEKLE